MQSAYFEDEKQEDISSKKAFGRLLPLLKPHVRWLVICFLLLASSKVIYLIGPELIRRAIDINIAGNDYNGLLITVGLYVLTQGVFLLLNFIFRIRMEMIGQSVMTKLRKSLFDHILEMAVSFFDRNPIGRLMSRVESDTEALRMMFTNTVVAMIGSLILIIGMFIWMFIVAPQLAFIVAVFIPIIAVLLYLYHRATTPKWLIIRKRMADITATLTEYLQGMQIIQIFNQLKMARRKLFEANLRKYKPEVKAELCVVVMFNSIFFMESVIIALVVYVGAKWVGAGEISIGTMVMFISYIRMFMEPVHMAAEEIAAVQKAVAGAKRIFGLMDTHEIVPESVRPVSWSRLEKSIVFEDVWFSYKGDENYALKAASFEIKRGQSFALAGVTGGGKSTVINLLLRFYDPQKGKITVDGIDIRNIPKGQLRAKFGLVLQDIILFPGNVAANVSLSSNGSDRSQIVNACRMVEADAFIDRMPDKYETELSERGGNLSRGERQLLSFARALVADPQILILDEATSSVDPETERMIQEGMATLMKGRTSIVIAHRLQTILNVDKILVVREGEIIERGSHDELMKQNGYYSKLFKLQFKQMNGNGVRKA
ncbi:MAG: ABC transporter ATP-binding protein [candidate division Zixibacteria bacterium]|nr:ABC transporter ATP-binding protein [candidate division Zixibacteria bacterium]